MSDYIAFSGGVESTTMLAMFHHKATAVFTDTGFEHDELYRQIERVEQQLGIEVVRVRRADGLTLQDEIKRTKFYPSPRARYCTQMFKIEPLDDYLRSRTPCRLMIGLNADEAEIRTGNLGKVEGVQYTYPLVDLGITRDKCIAFLKSRGLYPEYPAYMRRGGCVGCFYKSKREYALMAVHSPGEADMVADLEDELQDERESHYGLHGSIPNMRKFIESVRERERRRMLLPLKYEDAVVVPESCGIFCRR